MRERAARAYYALRYPTHADLWDGIPEVAPAKIDAYEVAQTVLSAALELPWPVDRPGVKTVYH